MTPTAPHEGLAPAADRVLGFTVGARNVRGRVVRLDAALNAVLSAHAYPPVLSDLLGQALVLTALLGSTLAEENDGQLTLQAQAKGGPVDLLVCDWRAGKVRGYLRHDVVPEATDLAALFGEGHLAITLDFAATGERYQGVVPLEGASLADAAEFYFFQSEQLPTLFRVAVRWDEARGWIGGGLLVQHLARAEIGGERLAVADMHPDWSHVLALASTTSEAELTDPDLSAEALLWRLFHEEEVRVHDGPVPARGCRCTLGHITSVIAQFPDDERAAMVGDDGRITVDCAFCARSFALTPEGAAA